MRRILAIVATLAIVSLIGAFFAIPALAHSSETSGDANVVYLDQPTLTRVAQTLGLTVDELTSQLQQGNTLKDIAAGQGVSDENVVATIIAPYQDELRLQVSYGYISQEQADSLLKEAQEHAQDLLTRDLSEQSRERDYTWDEMVNDCNEWMGDWSGSPDSQNRWGGMMGPGYMMGGWDSYGYQSFDPDNVPDTSRGFGGMMSDWGQSLSRGWNNMMGGLSGMMRGFGGSGGMMGW